MVALILIAAVIAYVFVFQIPTIEKIPMVAADITKNGNQVSLLFKNGDPLEQGRFYVTVNGNRVSDGNLSLVGGSYPWSPGERLVLNYSTSAINDVKLIYLGKPTSVVLASAYFPGSSGNITPALSVISITPNSGYNTSSVPVTDLIGTGFQEGATVMLNRTLLPDIPATSVTIASSTKISCIFNLSGVATVTYNVIVTNTNGESKMLVNGFTVYPPLPAPTVTSIAPTSGDRGWLVTITNLAGTGFQPGAVVKLVNISAGPDIIATNVVINPTGTSLTGIFDLTLAPAAKRNVTVTNPDGRTGTRINGVTVNSWSPTISKSTPSTGAQAATITITDLTGHYFQPGAIVVYSRDATSIPLTGVNVINNASITGTLVIPSNAPTGSYSVTVTNTDEKTGTRADTFTVTSNAPILSNRAPTTGDRGWPLGFTINGSRFQPGAMVTMTSGLKSSPVTDVNVISTTQITCTLNLLEAYVPTDATTGYSTWNITVTNPDGKTATGTGWFSVFSFRPAPVSPLEPDTGSLGTTVSTSIPGTYFQPGATAYLYRSGQPNIDAINVNVVSPTQITCDFPIPAGASTGLWNIRVTNDDGRYNTKSNAFTVTV